MVLMATYDKSGIRRRRRPESAIYWFDGNPYRVDLATIHRAMFAGIVAGKYKSLQHFADTVSRSRSTVSRFFTGRGVGLPVFLETLTELNLRFEDVATLVTDIGQR
jgi:hypothetical protein